MASQASCSEWFEHDGKGMPVGGHIWVDVRFRDGTLWEHHLAGSLERANENFWQHEPTSPEDDIVAYRTVSA